MRSRNVALFAVLVLHALGASLALRSRAAARASTEGQTIQVSLLQPALRADEPPPEVTPVLQKQVIDVPSPEVDIHVSAEPVMAVIVEQKAAPPAEVAVGQPSPRVISPADYLRQPSPHYPPLARKQRQQGLVMLRVSIGVDGLPSAVAVERSSGFLLLDRAACEAVRSAIFKPYIEAGVARAVQVLVPIEFSFAERLAAR